jgi:tyrosyl-tRNA synthetase
VRLDGEVVSDERLSLSVDNLKDRVLQVGKRRYARLVSAS